MSTGYKSNYPTSGYASETQLRNEFQKIQDALEDTISRTATGVDQGQDNSMHADLDLNNNDVFGVKSLSSEEVRTQELTIGGVGIQTLVDEATAQADRAERAAEELAVPYSFLGDYGSGLVATNYSQVVRDSDGELWRVSGKVDLPYTTTGTGLPEGDVFVPAGDAFLRQDLSDPSKGAGLIAYGGTTVEAALGELEQFNADLSDPDKGAAMVAYGNGSVADKLDEIVSGAVTEPIVDAKVLTHNHDPAAHPELSAFISGEADRAETARDAAFVNADVYPNTSSGRAAVADGEQFQVVVGDEIIRYQRDSASTHTEVARIIANAARRFSPIKTLVTSGNPQAQVGTVPEYIAYSSGDIFWWIPTSTNTGPMTININGLGDSNVLFSREQVLRAGEILRGHNYLIRISISGGEKVAQVLAGGVSEGGLPNDIRTESASSLAVSNPNLFTARQSAALSKDGMTAGGINQIIVDGVPHWSTTGTIRVWGPFTRESISGDTLSAAVNITAFNAEDGSRSPRVAVIQYSDSSLSINYEVARENHILTDFTPGFFRLEGVEIHPDCTHIGFFVGASGGNGSTITYRDMLLCSGSNSVFRTAPAVSISGGSKEVWLSPDGNDSGSGSSSLPFATLARAVSALGGRGTIYLAAGDYGSQRLNVSNVTDIKLVGGADSEFNRSVFRYGTRLTLTPVSGRPGIYSSPLSRTPAWLWADGIPDEQTLVPYGEQHSLLDGRAHRLWSTKIWHIPVDNLPDALDLIENSATPVCWRDTATNTVYLNLPSGASGVDTDVRAAFDDSGLIGNRPLWEPEGNLELTGLDVRYGNINTKGFRTSMLRDVRVLGAAIDGFDVGNWSALDQCEAGGCGSGDGLGDGFNAHNHAIWTYRDCYGHDNWDDGESSHQNCRVTGWGNIMEYNGGSGFTPALGAQQILHNCLSRKNATSSFRTGNKMGGFQVAGDPTPTDPGIITSLEAYNCVSIGDRNGFQDGTASVAPTQRRLLAVNCKVFDAEETAYACAEIRDCTQSGSATAKSSGTVVVNSSTVS